MPGENIAFAKYRDGHSKLGVVTIRARLIAYPTNLNIVDDKGMDLFSIPWGNLIGAYRDILLKDGLADTGSFIMRVIPGLDLTSGADPYYTGFSIQYYDDEIKRNQKVFFDCGSDRKANQIARKITFYRDNFHRNLGDQGRPETR